MPAWLISLLVSLAVKLGVPWLLRRFPGLPAWLVEILEELLGKLKDAKQDKHDAVREAKEKIHQQCNGQVGCPADTKDLG
jgi:hypothetical protein